MCVRIIILVQKCDGENNSDSRFRSSDLWVMSPTRYRCAKSLWVGVWGVACAGFEPATSRADCGVHGWVVTVAKGGSTCLACGGFKVLSNKLASGLKLKLCLRQRDVPAGR